MLVVAALIEFEGRLLVCQRRRGGAFELLWEFPGGKVKQGESLEAALARELHEELNVSATIGGEVYRARHQYSEMQEPVEAVFFAAKAAADEIENRVFERIEWRASESLGELEFLAADRGLIEQLVNGRLKL